MFWLLADDNNTACQAVRPEERRAALLALNDESRPCPNGDIDCTCGAYCNGLSGVCHVDCLSDDDAPDGYICSGGQACTPQGRCEESVDTPPPPTHALTIQITPGAMVANTLSGPAEVIVDVSVIANSFDFVRPDLPAVVRVQFEAARPGDDELMPLVKCAPQAAFSSFCDLDGGWAFRIDSDSLISDPRQIVVSVPQRTTSKAWTLEARSDWALLGALAVVEARPATEIGHYTGSMTLPDFGDGTASAVDVEAEVTATHIALFDPSRVLFPDSHIVIARDDTRTTMLRWMRSGVGQSPEYNVRIELASGTFHFAPPGSVTATLVLYDGVAPSTGLPFQLSLGRSGELAAACPASGSCAAGRYCEVAMNLCLPGSGSAAGPGIVSRSSAVPSPSLSSPLFEAWKAPLATVVASNPGHFPAVPDPPTGIPPSADLFGQRYCYQSSTQMGAAMFGVSKVLQEPSRDYGCKVGTAGETPQLTFPYVNRQTEVSVEQGGTLDLYQTCLSELKLSPTGRPATAQSLLDVRQCVSLGRLFLSLTPPRTTPSQETLAWHTYRQWLNLNAYVANTAVQRQQSDARLEILSVPAGEFLSTALDTVEPSLELMLDAGAPSPLKELSVAVARSSDYRDPRPVARWSFSTTQSQIPDAEAGPDSDGIPFAFSGPNTTLREGRLISGVGRTGSDTCQTTRPIGMPIGRRFTIMASLETQTFVGTKTFFRKDGADGDWLQITGTQQVGGSILFTMQDSSGRSVSFSFSWPVAPAIIAFSANSAEYQFSQYTPDPQQSLVVTTRSTNGPQWGTPGVFSVACGPAAPAQAPNAIAWDEIAIWDRPLSPAQVEAMARRYDFIPTNEILGPSLAVPGKEQSAGPAAILEAANADLNLVEAYIAAESSSIYDGCLRGTSTALDRTIARAGRNLRTAMLLEHIAVGLANLPQVNTAAWYPRYQANLQELGGRRIKVLSALRGASECRNSLGIGEDELPLFVGSTGSSAAERFFAGSRFLADQATNEIDNADPHLARAREETRAQQLSLFQEREVDHDRDDRIRRLSVDAEAQLRNYCGAPPGDALYPLLDGFRAGTFQASNCALQAEQFPDCRGLDTTPLKFVPPRCLRGQIGQQAINLQIAHIDSGNAELTHRRAVLQHDATMRFCVALMKRRADTRELERRHLLHMDSLRKQKRNAAFQFTIVKAYVNYAFSVYTAPISALDIANEVDAQSMDDDIANEQIAWEQTKRLADDADDVAACFEKAGNEEYAIAEAADLQLRSYKMAVLAQFNLREAHSAVTAIAKEALGQISIESTIDRTPPHLHYWIDEESSIYRTHFEYARRLAYLAVRAFEYESQEQRVSQRADVLNARLPEDLRTVVRVIKNATFPFSQSRSIDQGPSVLSLRDDILRLMDLSGNTTPRPGDPPVNPIEALRIFLQSDAAKIYGEDHRLVGRGIRFTIRPDENTANSCAERVWRIKPAVQTDHSRDISETKLVLAAANTFASQMCGRPPGNVLAASIRPSNYLFSGDAPPTPLPPRPFSTTNLFPVLNTSRETLRTMPIPDDDPSAFAGRGTYGDYILIFPEQSQPCSPTLCRGWSTDELAHVTDVLLRFDIVEVNNTRL